MRWQQTAETRWQGWAVPGVQNGVTTDPTVHLIQYGVSTASNVEPTDWSDGVWVKPAPLIYTAKALFGPAGIVLTVGANYVWRWIDADPEAIVELVDVITVPASTGTPVLDGGLLTDPNAPVDGGTP